MPHAAPRRLARFLRDEDGSLDPRLVFPALLILALVVVTAGSTERRFERLWISASFDSPSVSLIGR